MNEATAPLSGGNESQQSIGEGQQGAQEVGQQSSVDATQQNAKSAQDIATENEAAEWKKAEDDLFPGLKSVRKQDKKNEQTNGSEDEKTSQGGEASKDDNKDEEQDAGKGPSDDTKTQDANNQANDPAAAARAARLANRQYSDQVATVKSDVMQKMYADAPATLQDADGDPINSIEDVMQLIDPRTGEAFTENDAGMWLLSAQQEFNKQVAEREKNAEKVAELNVDIKDQADSINSKYGEFLKNNVELRDQLWQQFEKTLEKDPNSGIIVKMPLSLEEFYESQLAPRVEAQQHIQQQQSQAQAVQQQAQEQQQVQRQQSRQDRSDIYGAGDGNVTDQEDKEWAQARDAVFGPLK